MPDNLLKTALVVTSISSPNGVLKSLCEGAQKNKVDFILIGDSKSPKEFDLAHCNYYSAERQSELKFGFAKLCPYNHYSRKNIGYLIAIKKGADIIIETDDDNFPKEGFWAERNENQKGYFFLNQGWLNIYNYFADTLIWPRGFPLEFIKKAHPSMVDQLHGEAICPIQQGLADENPDVDAIYRLLFPLPFTFKTGEQIILQNKTICPFNSQNTRFFKRAFPLLYLPSYCSFRVTDIWRSFIAQRICWENKWGVLFHKATVWQERNEHNLLNDLKDEMPYYIHNDAIYNNLLKLKLKAGEQYLGDNLLICYEELIKMGLIVKDELNLLEAWNKDIASFAN